MTTDVALAWYIAYDVKLARNCPVKDRFARKWSGASYSARRRHGRADFVDSARPMPPSLLCGLRAETAMRGLGKPKRLNDS